MPDLDEKKSSGSNANARAAEALSSISRKTRRMSIARRTAAFSTAVIGESKTEQLSSLSRHTSGKLGTLSSSSKNLSSRLSSSRSASESGGDSGEENSADVQRTHEELVKNADKIKLLTELERVQEETWAAKERLENAQWEKLQAVEHQLVAEQHKQVTAVSTIYCTIHT
jgi:hypothetical protein